MKLVKKLNMKNISYDTILILILVSVLFIYMLISLDDTSDKVVQNNEEVENFEEDEDIEEEEYQNQKQKELEAELKVEKMEENQDNEDNEENQDNEDPKNDNKPAFDNKGISEKSSQDIVQTKDKKTTVVHNHYYGGNKELAKMMSKLLEEHNKNLNQNQMDMIDQGTCMRVNEKLNTTTLAEYKNNRFLADLKNKCDKQNMANSTCKIAPTQDQTSLIGTILSDARNTQVGSIIKD